MKILLCGVFWPSFGGIESLIDCIARELSAKGDNITIWNLSPDYPLGSNCTRPEGFPETIYIKNPCSIYEKLVLSRENDICIMFNLSLKAYWILLLAGTPVLITLHSASGWGAGWKERLKSAIVKNQRLVVACSSYIANLAKKTSVVIGSPVSSFFWPRGNLDTIACAKRKEREIVFVGRLIEDKGCGLLLDALSLIPKNIRPKLTVIGEGPQRTDLVAKCHRDDISADFLGRLTAPEISTLLVDFDIMVVPSLWGEPFGMVALEGLASGCRLIVSDSCGLEEAAGGYACTFARGDALSLSNSIKMLMDDTNSHRFWGSKGLLDHLNSHSQAVVANRYRGVAVQCFKNHHVV